VKCLRETTQRGSGRGGGCARGGEVAQERPLVRTSDAMQVCLVVLPDSLCGACVCARTRVVVVSVIDRMESLRRPDVKQRHRSRDHTTRLHNDLVHDHDSARRIVHITSVRVGYMMLNVFDAST
jgi:hypothetical protein